MIRAAAGDGDDDDDCGGGLRDPQLSIQRIIYEQSVSRPSSYEHTLQREQFLLEPLTTKLCDLRVHDVCVLLDAASYSYCYYYYYNGPHRPPVALPQASRGVLELPLQRPSVEADAYLLSTAAAVRAR